jgi:hypothetical protein
VGAGVQKWVHKDNHFWSLIWKRCDTVAMLNMGSPYWTYVDFNHTITNLLESS